MVSTFRANLEVPEFPLLTDFQGHTVLIPGIDQQGNQSVPQVYYMHNMVPTRSGLTSVGYQQVVAAASDTDNTFEEIFNVRDKNEEVALLARTTSGRNYGLNSIGSGWTRTKDLAPEGEDGIVTTAHVNGLTYICYSRMGLYFYSGGTIGITAFFGLDSTQVMGITAANGYMIAWTDTQVLWSSLTDPNDFVPSLATGAGGGAIQLAKAAIVACFPANGGFIIYTKRNAISATYTGNKNYPFSFKEIIGAGGLSHPSLCAYDGNSSDQLVYTTAGFQQVSMSNATNVFPQITDFIAGAQFEDYDEFSGLFNIQSLSSPMKKKLTQVGNRYIVISYGINSLTHAIIIDIGLQRWGKLKISHVDCFEYFYPSAEVVEAPKRSIGFLQADGKIQVAIVSYNTTGSYGVVMLGKYQLDRNRYLELQSIEVDSVNPEGMLDVNILTSVDGTNVAFETTPVLAKRQGTYRRYDTRASGLNHSLIFSGSMHLNSISLKINDAGEVR